MLFVRLALFFIVFIFLIFSFPSFNSKDTVIYIQKGSTVQSITSDLKEKDVINSKFLFKILVKLFHKERSFVSGEFLVREKTNLVSLLYYLTDPRNIYYHKITIVEGLTTKQILQIINSDEILEGKITLKPKEGSLMPDTYFFPKGETRDTLIVTMQNSMNAYLDNLWENRDKSLPYKNKQQALILASLVEKESSYADERELIAGVFLNRLRIGMKLQTDPTVAYGLNKISADKLTKKDLLTKHPYNTYIIYGLPPTPIANPSRKSLLAAFNPAKTDFLYFVANGKGGHTFTKNLVDHNKQVSKWRAIERDIRQRENNSTKLLEKK